MADGWLNSTTLELSSPPLTWIPAWSEGGALRSSNHHSEGPERGPAAASLQLQQPRGLYRDPISNLGSAFACFSFAICLSLPLPLA
ncbi:uncharacterized protein K460DRAFT_369716, partial [Cucurbitaria berberidis CBS 394.84]